MYLTVNGTEIFCTIAGSGAPCLVPSLAGTPIYERTFAPALDGSLRLIFAELRGNRTAVGDVATLTLGGLVEEMDGLRRALGLERVAVLGHSGHSILALAYAARFPERASRVVLVGGMPGFAPDLGEQIATYWDVVASPERKRLLAENRARLDDEALGRLTPSERLSVIYAADGPTYFHDPTYDCTPLWAGHDDFSPDLHRRFWGPGGQFAILAPTPASRASPRRCSSRTGPSTSRSRRRSGPGSGTSCRARRTTPSSAAGTTRSLRNARHSARR